MVVLHKRQIFALTFDVSRIAYPPPDLPVVSGWSLYSLSLPECGGDCDMVRAAYVKW